LTSLGANPSSATAPSPGSQLEEEEEAGKRIRYCTNLDAHNQRYKILLSPKLFLRELAKPKENYTPYFAERGSNNELNTIHARVF
jgi:hypothetical protein